MSFIITASGDELSLERPAPGHITAYTIAWALSQLNRFTGHAVRPYSVAEHSLLVCDIAEHELGLDAHGQLAALIHDAHEAFVGDLHTPGKREVGEAWYAWERKWESVVQSAFGLRTVFHVHADAIKRADLLALATEKRDLMRATPTSWLALSGIEPLRRVNLYSQERRAMDWEDWRDRWLDKYHELDFARNELLFPTKVEGGAA